MFVAEFNKNQTLATLGVVHDILPMKHFIKFSNYTNEMNGSVSVLDQLEYFDIPSNDMSCVRFNGIVNQRVYFPTANLMFEIGMNINWVLNPKNSSKSYHGMTYNEKTVFITDNYKKSLLESDYLTLEQNKAFYEVIAENTYHIHKLSEPYNRCSKHVDPTYRQINCIEECINMNFRTDLNCSIPSYFKSNGLESCFERSQNFEYNDADFEYNETLTLKNNHTSSINKLIGRYYNYCKKWCPKECFVSKWNTPKKTRFVNNTKDFGLRVVLAQYFPLNLTQIPKMTGINFLQDIGGTLSLFVGVSFFSIVELFEFFVDVLYAIVSDIREY
jgi:hypothetical protein